MRHYDILQKLIVSLLNEKVQIYEKCCHVFALVVDVPIFGKGTVGEVMNLSALPMAGNLQPVPQSYLVSMLNSFRNVLHKGAPMQWRRPYNHHNLRYGASFLLHWLINVQNCTNPKSATGATKLLLIFGFHKVLCCFLCSLGRFLSSPFSVWRLSKKRTSLLAFDLHFIM